jgi:hypothetical protein
VQASQLVQRIVFGLERIRFFTNFLQLELWLAADHLLLE